MESDEENYKQCVRVLPTPTCAGGYEGTQVRAGRSNHFSRKKPHNKKQRISPLLLSGWYPPQVLAKIQTYCSGPSVPAQVLRLAELERTIASAVEQNERTPVRFTLTGFVHEE